MNWLQVVSRFLVNFDNETGEINCKNGFNIITEFVFVDICILAGKV